MTLNTVLGPIDTSELGFTLSHEHVSVGSGGFPYTFPEFLDRQATLERAVRDLTQAREEGVHTIIDMAPHDQGRDVRLQEEVSRLSGVNIVACSGTWLDVPRFFWDADPNKIADIYSREIENGIDGTSIKAGILKAASDAGGIKPQEEIVLRAVSRASIRTGSPIMTHTWAPERIGLRQVEVFQEEGVDLDRVCIGHSNDTTDLGILVELLETGVWLGMDRYPQWASHVPTWTERTQTVAALIDAGWGHRVLLGHDWDSTIGLYPPEARAEKEAGNPDNYLFITRRVLPLLKSLGASTLDISALLVDNPRRFFEGRQDAKEPT